MDDDLSNFAGVVRLFPLPNLVMFPHVVQPLHIFEPRYREMTADALAGDRLIAMALQRPDGEKGTGASADFHAVACLVRIVAFKELDDGRYILLVRGVSRIRIVEELPSEKQYRGARVELMEEVVVLPVDEARAFRHRLAELILPRFAGSEAERTQVQELLEGETPLGALCDVLCYQLPLPPERKQQLLEETDVSLRARALIDELQAIEPAVIVPRDPNRKFPPEFSPN
jgi:Lon protease-like protein